jgi:hypothetical protein
MKILFLTLYSKLGGSSRYMVYDYLEYFRQAGIEVVVSPLFDERYHLGLGDLSAPTGLRNVIRNFDYYVWRVAKRLKDLIKVGQFDIVALEKELPPYFPFGMEKFIKSY